MSGPTLTVGRDCELAGATPSLIEEIKRQLTIDNPKYRDALKYGRWIGKSLKPHLRYYTLHGEAIRFPRGFARQAIHLCRRFMKQSPRIIDKRSSLSETSFHFQGELRPYQEQALSSILSRDFGVLEAGTGSGKTVVALAVVAARRQPTLVLVHTKELLHQWAARAETFLGIPCGMVGDSRFEPAPLTVAIVNSARRRLHELTGNFGQIIVDECHRVPASLFTEVVTGFDCRYMLGLSATAFRRDGLTKIIYLYLGDRVHRIDTRELQRSGAILKPRFIQRPTEFRYHYRGNYQALLKALTADPARNRLIVGDILKEAGHTDGSILVVSDRVEHCQTLAAMLEEKGLQPAVLTGRLKADERGDLVERIRAGQVKVVIATVQLIGEGFDCPNLETLFLTTPIKFTGRLLQVVGRILRPADGKEPRVYDYADPVRVLSTSAHSRWLTFQVE